MLTLNWAVKPCMLGSPSALTSQSVEALPWRQFSAMVGLAGLVGGELGREWRYLAQS
jgi:hypothetical protein